MLYPLSYVGRPEPSILRPPLRPGRMPRGLLTPIVAGILKFTPIPLPFGGGITTAARGLRSGDTTDDDGEHTMSDSSDWSPDEPSGSDPFEQGDEALDDKSQLDPESPSSGAGSPT